VDQNCCLKGKSILITGASSGIGAECSILFSKLGASVILVGRDNHRLKTTYSQLSGGNHHILELDITKYLEVESLVSEAVIQVGKISGFIHSAGIELTLPFKMSKPSHYEELFAVNVISGFNIAKILAKKKYCETPASYVFISSVMGLKGGVGKVVYSCSKGAIISGVRSMALELSRKNIRVNAISPSIVITPMVEKLFEQLSGSDIEQIERSHPLGCGSPLDIANMCAYLLSDNSKWITGSNIVADGGFAIQ